MPESFKFAGFFFVKKSSVTVQNNKIIIWIIALNYAAQPLHKAYICYKLVRSDPREV